MVSVGVLEKSMSLLYAVVLGAPLTIGNVCVCVFTKQHLFYLLTDL